MIEQSAWAPAGAVDEEAKVLDAAVAPHERWRPLLDTLLWLGP